MYAEFYMAYIKIVRSICIKCTYLIWECDDELSLQRDKSLAACTPSLCSWFWLFFWGINTSLVNTASRFQCLWCSDRNTCIEMLLQIMTACTYTGICCYLVQSTPESSVLYYSQTPSVCLPAYSNGYVCEGPPSDSSRWSVLPTVYKTAVGVGGGAPL